MLLLFYQGLILLALNSAKTAFCLRQISKDLVLDMGVEHECLRSKKLNEEKFVLDLLTIVLINGQQYNLLTQVYILFHPVWGNAFCSN